MKIKLTSVLVEDQASALTFYTEILGFQKKLDLAMGEFRWLTVVGEESEEIELLLEPNQNPAAKTFQAALFEQGIPLTAFATDDVQGEYGRLTGLGVIFRGEPRELGGTMTAVFEDTCGNLIQIYEG